jgi:hypothetical protein
MLPRDEIEPVSNRLILLILLAVWSLFDVKSFRTVWLGFDPYDDLVLAVASSPVSR